MPLFLLSPIFRYGMAALAVLSLLGALYVKGHSDGTEAANTRWEAGMARQATVAAKLYSDKLAEIAALERDRETLNTRLSKEVADAREETDAALADFNRRAAVLMRRPEACPAANPTPGGPPPVGASGDTELEGTGIFIPRQAIEDLGRLGALADDTAAVMLACQKWAVSVGR